MAGAVWPLLLLVETRMNYNLQFIQTEVFETNRNKQECQTTWIYPDTIYHIILYYILI